MEAILFVFYYEIAILVLDAQTMCDGYILYVYEYYVNDS